MDNTNSFLGRQRLSSAKKNKDGKKWYKDQLDALDKTSSKAGDLHYFSSEDNVGDYRRKKINYDMLNGIINMQDYKHIINPSNDAELELPATLMNRDIINPKIKVLQGMEISRSFSYKLVATNKEATTRKEEEEAKLLKDFVMEQIMAPIKQKLQEQAVQQMQQGDLTEEQKASIQQELKQQEQAMTPDRISQYMKRDHQDPAEVQGNQILTYLYKKLDIDQMFLKGWKHALASAYEVYYCGILNKEIIAYTINSLHFDCDRSNVYDDIADGEWAKYNMYLTPSEITRFYGDQLTNKEIDRIYDSINYKDVADSLDWSFDGNNDQETQNKIRVMHGTWKSLRKIGFLTFIDEEGETQEMIVGESYKLNPDFGDLKIKWEWIPNVEEGTKIIIDDPIYVNCRPVLGQSNDLDKINEAKLPYTGVVYDDMNSNPTGMVDRLKSFQYLINIICHKVEMLMHSDKGKLLLLNSNMIPTSMGMDIKTWKHFADTSNIGWMNPNEEGNRGGGQGSDIVNAAKMVDMSLASDINQYIQLADYLERKAGDAVGIPKEMEGQVGQYQGVRNTQAAMAQSKHILEPYFDLHNFAKRNFLQKLIDTAKVCYTLYPKEHLNYMLDDMSIEMFKLDIGLLENSTYGLFVSNSSKDNQIKENIQQLIHAAMQAGRADLSDVVRVFKSDDTQEIEELLAAAEERKTQEQQAHEQRMKEMEQQAAKEAREAQAQFAEKEHAYDMELERLKQQGAIEKQLILSMGFNEDKDLDKDGVPDVLEIAQDGLKAQIDARKQELDEKKFEHQKVVDKEKLKIEKMKTKEKPKSK